MSSLIGIGPLLLFQLLPECSKQRCFHLTFGSVLALVVSIACNGLV